LKVQEECHLVGTTLRKLGFNMNLAPVLDIRKKEDSFIGSRSFSRDPKWVKEVGKSCYLGFREAGILCCAKHFPGIGDAVVDPHVDLPVINLGPQELLEDVYPFQELIKEGIPAVMTTHVMVRKIDPTLPGTFSPRVLDFLKKDLDFKGLAIADDLEMGAVPQDLDMGEAAVLSVAAGHDLVLICRSREKILRALYGLREGIIKYRVTPRRIREAILRLRSALNFVTSFPYS
jgi:beta-N-acetylhexosaminidase